MRMVVVDVPPAFGIVPVGVDVGEIVAIGLEDRDLRSVAGQPVRAARLIAVMMREDDPFDRRDTQFGQPLGHATVAAVNQEGLVSLPNNAHVYWPVVDEQVRAQLGNSPVFRRRAGILCIYPTGNQIRLAQR